MAHNHHHHKKAGNSLLFSILLNSIITAAQVIGGIVSGSLALLSDAMHNLSDVISLTISYIANVLTKKKASAQRTFGYKRAEIIAAFVNASSLIIVSVFLIKEATERILEPKPIGSTLVILLSLLGILINGVSVLLIQKHAESNMNLQSAYLHLFTDMLASIAVLLGGISMYYFEFYWIDPVLTILIALYLIYMGFDLLVSSTRVLMLFTPDHIEVKEIEIAICRLPEIKNVHHLHIWQLNETEIHLEAHIDFKSDIKLSEFDHILINIEKLLWDEFGINHVNLQPEYLKKDPKHLIVQD